MSRRHQHIPTYKPYDKSVPREVTGMDLTAEEISLQEVEYGAIKTIFLEEEPLTFYDKQLKIPAFHIHQKDDIDICSNFLAGRCQNTVCPQHHTVLPYTWQLRDSGTAEWSNVNEDAQEALERLYSDPKRAQVTGVHMGSQVLIDFTTMVVHQSKVFDHIRRIGTSSSTSDPFCTCYKFYYEEAEDIWTEYEPEFVIHIEEGLRNCNEKVYCSSLKFNYVLNLTKMYQKNVKTGTRRRMRVRPVFRSRVKMKSELWTLSSSRSNAFLLVNFSQSTIHPELRTSYPETWLISDTSADHEKIILKSDDGEYPHVYSYFHKTMPESKYIIMEITRIQNYFQWDKYKRKRNHMTRTLTASSINCVERHLFHGTEGSLVEAICRQNFDARVCGKHGTVYGQGCYFAKTASYSHSYATATTGDEQHYMFLAKVLIGRPAAGYSSLRRPPPLYPEDPASPLYDSCVSRLNDPDIFIVFDNDQFYPYFLIKYEKLKDLVILD
ncbi:protein mono-ADP-ribosyltransferase TIPARP-like [Discoglossus pictus]